MDNPLPINELSVPPSSVFPSPDTKASLSRRLISQSLVGWFAITMLLLIYIGIAAYKGLQSLVSDNAWVTHTHEMIHELDEVRSRLYELEATQRGYILTNNDFYLKPYGLASQLLRENLNVLRIGMVDNVQQQQRLAELTEHIDRRVKLLEQVVQEFRGGGGLQAAQELIIREAGRKEMEAALAAIEEMRSEEYRLLRDRRRAANNTARLTLQTEMAAIVASVVIFGAFFWLVRRESQRQARSESSLAAFNQELQQATQRLELSLFELKKLTDERKAIADLGDYLQGCRTQEEAFDVLARNLPKLTNLECGAVGLLHSSRHFIEVVTSWGPSEATNGFFVINECWALRRGMPHLALADGPHPRCEHIKPGQKTTICVPLVANGETLGVIYLASQTQPGIDESVTMLVKAVSEHFALSIGTIRLQQTLLNQSIRDPLTGLYNRRYLEESLERELVRARRHRHPVGVIMLDVDHFKKFNDTHGHNAGDILLREFGAVLRKHFRGDDIACRYGGEEFTVIMPDSDLSIVLSRAERIRQLVKQIHLPFREKLSDVITASVGVAVFPDHGETPAALIQLADAALYQAKRDGRDRVVSAFQIHDRKVEAPLSGQRSDRVVSDRQEQGITRSSQKLVNNEDGIG